MEFLLIYFSWVLRTRLACKGYFRVSGRLGTGTRRVLVGFQVVGLDNAGPGWFIGRLQDSDGLVGRYDRGREDTKTSAMLANDGPGRECYRRLKSPDLPLI